MHEGHARKPLVWLRVYSGEVRRAEAATLCAPGLQPYVLPGCNPMCSRAATLCAPGLQPYVVQVRRGDTLLNTRTGEREVVAQLYPYPYRYCYRYPYLYPYPYPYP